MAGIGVKLNRISVFANLVGFTYSTVATVAPMILVISAIVLMGWVLGLNRSEYLAREVFFCTVLYIFIFALLTASPFNAVLSKYMSDAIRTFCPVIIWGLPLISCSAACLAFRSASGSILSGV